MHAVFQYIHLDIKHFEGTEDEAHTVSIPIPTFPFLMFCKISLLMEYVSL